MIATSFTSLGLGQLAFGGRIGNEGQRRPAGALPCQSVLKNILIAFVVCASKLLFAFFSEAFSGVVFHKTNTEFSELNVPLRLGLPCLCVALKASVRTDLTPSRHCRDRLLQPRLITLDA